MTCNSISSYTGRNAGVFARASLGSKPLSVVFICLSVAAVVCLHILLLQAQVVSAVLYCIVRRIVLLRRCNWSNVTKIFNLASLGYDFSS